MKKILLTTMLAAVSAMAVGRTQIGPVSTYGELKASGNKLVGSCPDYANKAVQVRGMSLFWSSGNTDATDFYTEKGVYHLVDDMKVEVLRYALGVAEEKFDAHGRAYTVGGEDFQKAQLRNTINAAIEKDIYLIIDWHIESSSGFTDEAVKFFEWAAQEYGSYNNIIFEIWNEPTGDMNAVKAHADRVIPAIRKYSDNLILVGSPSWSAQPDECAKAGITDKNYACTLHFYAAEHPRSGEHGQRAQRALDAGVPVFASEWGTVNANGDGGPQQGPSQDWVSWMNQNGVSWTNWNASAMDETSAAFKSASFDNGLSYTESGNMVKGWMNTNGSYKDCGLQNGSGSEQSGFSKGVANGEVTSMIDDMEDGDRYNYIGGWWGAFEDNADGGKSYISNAKIEDEFGKQTYDVLLPSDGGDNTSQYMVGLKDIKLDIGTLEWGPYVALGLTLKKDTSTYADFAKCKTIKYKYKGASHNFRIETTDITDWNFHRVNKVDSKDWKEVEITIDQLKQETWGNDDAPQKPIHLENAQRLAWEIKGDDKGLHQPTYNYLYVDDLSCDGLSITAVSAKEPASSSSAAPTSADGSSSSGIPTSSPVATSSATSQVTTVFAIDDVEDGNEVLNTTGTWYAYNDSENGGLSTFSNVYDAALPGYVVVFPGTEDPTNGTQGFVGIKDIAWNQGTYKYDPFVAIGINLNADTSLGSDLSQCNAISYRYKGAKHTVKIQDGSVTDFAYHQRITDSSSVWKTVVYELSAFSQPSWASDPHDLNYASIKKMAWEVIGAAGEPIDYQPAIKYLYIDDLNCVTVTKDAIKSVRIATNSIRLGVQGNNLSVNLDKAGSVRVQIFDLMGHAISNTTESMNAGANTVSLEKMSKGSYIVRVVRGSEVKAARVTIR